MKKIKDIYSKLKINGIVDLDNIAKEYELTRESLIEFHNKHCQLHELLPLHLPKYVEYIYLPTDLYEARQKKLVKNTNLYYPTPTGIKKYGVSITFLPKDLKIHYTIDVARKAYGLVKFHKNKTYVNNQEITRVIEQLMEKAEKALYPLQLSLNDDGSLRQIANGDDIYKRWQQDILPQLKSYYQSEVANDIFKKIDVKYSDINKHKKLLIKSIFYNLFMLPIYRRYPNYVSYGEPSVYFSGLNDNIGYNTTFKLNREYSRSGKIRLAITGQEKENNFTNHQKKGKFEFHYKLHPKTHEIFSITGYASSFKEEKEHRIDFGMYELDND